MISVIIPAYNVERYIDQCMESVTGQTYSDLEIILVNDGSTDRTAEHCQQWAEKDRRIRYVFKENGGMGATRNCGLSMARGEYILFVDSDDWLEKECIEKMCRWLERERVDMCLTEYYAVDGKEKRHEKLPHLSNRKLNDLDRIKLILFSPPSTWGKLYRKSFLDKISYEQPTCVFEDAAVYPYVVSQAEKVCCVYEPLWNYRTDNKISIMHQWKNYPDLPKAFLYGRMRMKAAGCLARYEAILKHKELCHFALSYDQWKGHLSQEDLSKYFELPFKQYLDSYYPKWQQEVYTYYFVWGSFALRWLAGNAMLCYSRQQGHCPFSSIISQFMGKKGDGLVEHPNLFRQHAVEDDMQGNFLEKIKKCVTNKELGVLLIDFMEERYSVIHTRDDVYITQSEAFLECNPLSDMEGSEVLRAGSRAFMQIWREACRRFVQYLQKDISGIQVILVKSRMTEWYGKRGKEKMFLELDAIRCYNQMFEEMEDYFLELYPVVKVIELPEELLYTDIDGRYGCDCQYWNKEIYCNQEIAIKMLPDINKLGEI